MSDNPMNETSPLLQQPSRDGGGGDSASHSNRNSQYHVLLICVVVAGLDFTVFMLNLPLTRVYESILCYQYFRKMDPSRFSDPAVIPEGLCKVDSIQEELGLIRGFELLFMSLPGVLMALPYGALADRWGRKPTLSLCAAGLAASLTAVLLVCRLWWMVPIRLVWAAWALTVVGGGASVMVSTSFSMLTDITDDTARAKVFLQLTVAILVGQAIASPLASLMMAKFGTTVPILVGYSIGLTSCILTLFIPETIHKGADDGGIAIHQSSEYQSTISPSSVADSKWRLFTAASTVHIANAWNAFEFIFSSPSLLAVITSFFINTIGSSAINSIVQYMSKRFSISISSAGLFLTIRGGMAIFLFLVGLPLIGAQLRIKFGVDGPPRDLLMAKLTVLCIPLGFFLIAVGQQVSVVVIGMALTACGSGSGSIMRSVAASMVDNRHVARLHAAISLVDTFGALISGPLLAEAFALGLRMGHGWISLPFVIAAVLTFFGASIVWLVKLPKQTYVDAESL